jgi:hypothetical protein
MQVDHRSSLAQYFSDIATWHQQSLENGRHATEESHQRQIGFFSRLAEYVQSLSDDDLRVVALARLTGLDQRAVFSPGPRVSAALGESELFADVEPGVFLEHLVHAALDDEIGMNHRPVTILMPGVQVSEQVVS